MLLSSSFIPLAGFRQTEEIESPIRPKSFPDRGRYRMWQSSGLTDRSQYQFNIASLDWAYIVEIYCHLLGF